MAISKEQVTHVANLARLSFDDAELSQFTDQMSEITDMFNELQAVDTTDVEPMTHVVDLVNVVREDVPAPADPEERKALLANAPDTEDGYIKVPAIFNNGEDSAE
ncbi:Asp-tRNA(Asn)/Glu-tRNA(Gln) amidotransferase subunit GatC [Loigolactobacillus jiayinensis]|uniref:Aspartyl/glutamyl-tRNA(Asn/Gln) amidotransferase subunit C n=1 Tax=Loigolactobacillus jiayinensis TaxID=2486016 RepID=A0ABW1RBK7_9LACO|nr:Asp-tRNA(Asn)/Glu-tRNA(Gln) amidotransferase subunit GatC [Loigolactobacillus jiayinensis]